MSLDLAREIIKFWIPIAVAIVSLFINVIQVFSYKKVKNKISVWAKDAKSMANSIVGLQKNIKDRKVSTLADVASSIEILGNFSNSMYTSLEEELGRKKREINIKKKK